MLDLLNPTKFDMVPPYIIGNKEVGSRNWLPHYSHLILRNNAGEYSGHCYAKCLTRRSSDFCGGMEVRSVALRDGLMRHSKEWGWTDCGILGLTRDSSRNYTDVNKAYKGFKNCWDISHSEEYFPYLMTALASSVLALAHQYGTMGIIGRDKVGGKVDALFNSMRQITEKGGKFTRCYQGGTEYTVRHHARSWELTRAEYLNTNSEAQVVVLTLAMGNPYASGVVTRDDWGAMQYDSKKVITTKRGSENSAYAMALDRGKPTEAWSCG